MHENLALLVAQLDELGVMGLSLACVIWATCRARRMSRRTPIIDRLAIVAMAMGAAGIFGEFVKWVDVGYWPLFFLLLGSASWNGLPNLRELIARKMPAQGPIASVVRSALGMRHTAGGK